MRSEIERLRQTSIIDLFGSQSVETTECALSAMSVDRNLSGREFMAHALTFFGNNWY